MMHYNARLSLLAWLVVCDLLPSWFQPHYYQHCTAYTFPNRPQLHTRTRTTRTTATSLRTHPHAPRDDATTSTSSDYTAVMIVPTGIGAAIGGYAGDALPAARLLASIATTLITHPNVLNGAMLYWPMPNVLYVEGYALDEFAAGALALRRVNKGGNKIGLLLDSGIEAPLRLRLMQVADAFRATLGITVHAACTTPRPMGIEAYLSTASGASWGSVRDPEALLEGGRWLVGQGCDAIAVVGRFPEDDDDDEEEEEEEEAAERERKGQGTGVGGSGSVSGSSAALFADYRQGQGVDAIAGAEALISHILTKSLVVPCAHAPAFRYG